MKTQLLLLRHFRIFILAIILLGCGDSNTLSESEAEAIIKELNHGSCSHGIREYKKFTPRYSDEQQYVDYYRALNGKGVFNFNKIGTNSSRVFGKKPTYSALLSKEGEKYKTGAVGDLTLVKSFEFEFDKIVGIFQDENALTAEIEYTVKFIGTPFYIPNTLSPNQYRELKQKLDKEGITILNDSGIGQSSWRSKLKFENGDIQKRKVKVRKYKEQGWQVYH